jgi:hypothetical protein
MDEDLFVVSKTNFLINPKSRFNGPKNPRVQTTCLSPIAYGLNLREPNTHGLCIEKESNSHGFILGKKPNTYGVSL